jgi:ABC-type proline/glycine betaine transport system permease subunit
MRLYTVLLLQTALHISGSYAANHQEHIQLHSQHLVLVVVSELLPPAVVVSCCKLLYMFRAATLPIIRSTYNCIHSIWY